MTNTHMRIVLAACASIACAAQPSTPKIVSIAVEKAIDVVGPDGTPINKYVGGGISDEHITIFPPKTLPQPNSTTLQLQNHYLFFVATRTPLTPQDTGLLVLKAPPKAPARKDAWVLDFAPAYGRYGGSNGVVFSSAMVHGTCPAVYGDATFDLNYAAGGTVFPDPTDLTPDGYPNVNMLYEGSNRCIGNGGGANKGNNFYSTLGVATSSDYGLAWPVYAANFTALPGINPSFGPLAPSGAWGPDVCVGDYCSAINLLQPPPTYGRYAVSGPVTTISEAMQSAVGTDGSLTPLSRNTGESEPSAFLDTISAGTSNPYLYVVHTYNPGPFGNDSPLYPNFPAVEFDLAVSRAQLNGGTARLQFFHWYENKLLEPALGDNGGGHEDPLFLTQGLAKTPQAFDQCLSPLQSRSDGSISYSEETHEYVLFFVCGGPSKPENTLVYPPPPTAGAPNGGAAWFFSTIDADQYDLSHQDQWSVPRMVVDSWSPFQAIGCAGYYDGWYPSLMSADAKPGFLRRTGWVFSMTGCEGGASASGSPPPGRTYTSRVFVMRFQ